MTKSAQTPGDPKKVEQANENTRLRLACARARSERETDRRGKCSDSFDCGQIREWTWIRFAAVGFGYDGLAARSV